MYPAIWGANNGRCRGLEDGCVCVGGRGGGSRFRKEGLTLR